jgi:hypothetical protein
LAAIKFTPSNRERAIDPVQQLELNTAEKLAALLESELGGVSRTLRAVAHAVAADPHAIDHVLDQQDRCSENLCFTALAILGSDGVQRPAKGRPLALTNVELADSVDWMHRAPHDSVRVAITSPRPPSLVVFTPTPQEHPGGLGTGSRGMLAAETSLDALFRNHQRSAVGGWPNYETLVLKRDGTVVFHSEHPEMQLNNVYRRTQRCGTCHSSFEHVERMLAIQHGVLEYETRNTSFLAAVAPVRFEDESWIVAVKVPREAAVSLLSAGATLGGLFIANRHPHRRGRHDHLA